MTFEPKISDQAFVWIWLPGEFNPIVAGPSLYLTVIIGLITVIMGLGLYSHDYPGVKVTLLVLLIFIGSWFSLEESRGLNTGCQNNNEAGFLAWNLDVNCSAIMFGKSSWALR